MFQFKTTGRYAPIFLLAAGLSFTLILFTNAAPPTVELRARATLKEINAKITSNERRVASNQKTLTNKLKTHDRKITAKQKQIDSYESKLEDLGTENLTTAQTNKRNRWLRLLSTYQSQMDTLQEKRSADVDKYQGIINGYEQELSELYAQKEQIEEHLQQIEVGSVDAEIIDQINTEEGQDILLKVDRSYTNLDGLHIFIPGKQVKGADQLTVSVVITKKPKGTTAWKSEFEAKILVKSVYGIHSNLKALVFYNEEMANLDPDLTKTYFARHILNSDEIPDQVRLRPDLKRLYASDQSGYSCDISELKFSEPLEGEVGRRWYISYYYDHDRNLGQLEDYQGKEATYNGHVGTDYSIANFRRMDRNTAKIMAVENGTVEHIDDGYRDRNNRDSSMVGVCDDFMNNKVYIRHDNGFLTIYKHLKKNSIQVKIGDRVQAGDVIGVMGSSGCSTGPHLHFEVRGCDGETYDPFKENMWLEEAEYEPETKLMDFAISHNTFKNVQSTRVPPPLNVTQMQSGTQVGWAFYWSTPKRQRVQVRFFKPNGSHGFTLNRTLGSGRMWRTWGTARLSTKGQWVVRVYLGSKNVRTFPIWVQ